MSFVTEMNKAATAIRTDNGAHAYSTTDSAVLDFYAVVGGLRNASMSTVVEKYKRARKENEDLADRIVLYARDIRAGAGERKVGRILLHSMATIAPDKVAKNLDKFAEMGRWDDLYVLERTRVENDMWQFLKTQFTQDLADMREGKPVSLLAKWLKSVKTSSDESRRLGKKTARMFGITERNYRKALSKLRAYLKVVEVKMSAREWEDITYSEVPSVAMTRYRHAFAKNSDAFREYLSKLQKGDEKINAGALFPYNITHEYMKDMWGWYKDVQPDPVIEAQWKAFPNYIEGRHNVVCMADVSGSMSGEPMETSIGLALYFAEHNTGPYQNLYLTFTDRPQFFKVNPEDSLAAKVKEATNHVGYNTNLDGALAAIYELARKADDAPKALVIISDEEIDRFTSSGRYVSIVEKWQSAFDMINLEMPKIIFWNVKADDGGKYLEKMTNEKVAFCSGKSATGFKNLTNMILYDAYQSMLKVLLVPRYDFA